MLKFIVQDFREKNAPAFSNLVRNFHYILKITIRSYGLIPLHNNSTFITN